MISPARCSCAGLAGRRTADRRRSPARPSASSSSTAAARSWASSSGASTSPFADPPARAPPCGRRPRREEDRRLRLQHQIVHLVAHLPADLEHVAEALGGDQADARALALQHRVGRDGGAVGEAADGVGRQAPFRPRHLRSAASTALLGSPRVVGTLVRRMPPSGARHTTSVKVPPISMPISQRPSAMLLSGPCWPTTAAPLSERYVAIFHSQ